MINIEFDSKLGHDKNETDDDNEFSSYENAVFDNDDFNKNVLNEIQIIDEETLNNSEMLIMKTEKNLRIMFPNIKCQDETVTININQSKNQSKNQLFNKNFNNFFSFITSKIEIKQFNWIRLKIRYNLFLKLKFPFDLDQVVLNDHFKIVNQKNNKSNKSNKSNKICHPENDIESTIENGVRDIKLDQLKANNTSLLNYTDTLLSKIEFDNLNNSSFGYLEKCTEEIIDLKLDQFKKNYDELLLLDLFWKSKLNDLISNSKIYEEVIQSHIGYSQKINRKKIFEKKEAEKKKKKN